MKISHSQNFEGRPSSALLRTQFILLVVSHNQGCPQKIKVEQCFWPHPFKLCICSVLSQNGKGMAYVDKIKWGGGRKKVEKWGKKREGG